MRVQKPYGASFVIQPTGGTPGAIASIDMGLHKFSPSRAARPQFAQIKAGFSITLFMSAKSLRKASAQT
jgi:hypothetical protein